MRRRRAQVATEYMMAISVVVIAAVAAGYKFHAPLRDGFRTFGGYFKTYFANSGGAQSY